MRDRKSLKIMLAALGVAFFLIVVFGSGGNQQPARQPQPAPDKTLDTVAEYKQYLSSDTPGLECKLGSDMPPHDPAHFCGLYGEGTSWTIWYDAEVCDTTNPTLSSPGIADFCVMFPGDNPQADASLLMDKIEGDGYKHNLQPSKGNWPQ